MATNLNTLPEDPEASDVKEEAPAKPKRKRRTKEQIAADKEAQALGFKDAADRAKQEAEMAENPAPAEAEDPAQPEPAPETEGELTGEATAPPKFELGQTWNLGGASYIVSGLGIDGSVVFQPNDD